MKNVCFRLIYWSNAINDLINYCIIPKIVYNYVIKFSFIRYSFRVMRNGTIYSSSFGGRCTYQVHIHSRLRRTMPNVTDGMHKNIIPSMSFLKLLFFYVW